MKNKVRQIFMFGLLLLIPIILLILVIDYNVKATGGKYILSANEVPNADAILILGAYVFPSGRVSDMLGDRLKTGLEIYAKGKANKILVSGDHGKTDYDEVNAMKKYLKDRSIKSEDVFMDHAGFSTYESIYRARDIFQAKKLIIVSQEYHLNRAIYIARSLGIEAYGVPADKHVYGKIVQFKLREIVARNKDFFLTMIKPKPTYLGEAIPITSDGRLTDDKKE